MRKLALVCSAVLSMPLTAHALGLGGDIDLQSALNQPFEAKVDLTLASERELRSVNISIASYEEFEKAGLERVSVLSDFKFRIETREDGSRYIKVTSDKPVKEPFLDFLIEVDWPNGHLVREYTVLLDLPVLVDVAPVAVEAAVLDSDRVTIEPDLEAEPMPVAASQPRSMPGEAARSGELYYGRVKRNDTLWEIAGEIKPGEASRSQVMMALLKSNPEAFINNNINNLKAGYVLRVPDANSVYAMSKQQAAQQNKLHYERWLDAKQRRAGKASTRPLGSETGTLAGTRSVVATGARLKLAAPDVHEMQDTSQLTGPSSEILQQEDMVALNGQLQMALGAADTSSQENSQLRDRMLELEMQLARLERLLSLRDDTLAVMQQNSINDQADEQDQIAVIKTLEEAGVRADQSSEAMLEENLAISSVKGEGKDDGLVHPATVQSSVFDKAIAGVFAVAEKAMSHLMLLASVLVGLLLLIAGVKISRRRKDNALDDAHAALLAEATDELAQKANVGSDDIAQIGEEIGGLAARDSVDMGAEIDEIDVLAEADVYVAYHRYDRAEELLKDAIAVSPVRIDLKVKLLEVYSESRNVDLFVAAAEALQPEIDTNSAEWQEVLVMGRAIAPSHAFFAVAGQEVSVDDDIQDKDIEEFTSLNADDSGSDESKADDLSSLDLPGADLDADLGSELDALEMSLGGESDMTAELDADSGLSMGDDVLTIDDVAADDVSAVDLDAGLQEQEPEPAAMLEPDLTTSLGESDTGLDFAGEISSAESADIDTSLDFPMMTDSAETDQPETDQPETDQPETDQPETDQSGDLNDDLQVLAEKETELDTEVVDAFSVIEEDVSNTPDVDTVVSDDIAGGVAETGGETEDLSNVMDFDEVVESPEPAETDIPVTIDDQYKADEETALIDDAPVVEAENELADNDVDEGVGTEGLINDLLTDDQPLAESPVDVANENSGENQDEIVGDVALADAPSGGVSIDDSIVESPSDLPPDDVSLTFEEDVDVSAAEKPMVEGSTELPANDDISMAFEEDIDVSAAEKPMVEGSTGLPANDDISMVFEEDVSVAADLPEIDTSEMEPDIAAALDSDIDWLSNDDNETDDAELEVGGLFSGEDEVATKLDLARAYIDMGDQESARSILDEVTSDGTDEQKQEADKLIQQIA